MNTNKKPNAAVVALHNPGMSQLFKTCIGLFIAKCVPLAGNY